MHKINLIIIIFSTVISAQKNYYVSKDGSKDFSSISEVNSANFQPSDIVSFKSGEIFSDATLICQEGVLYNTYGGPEKAIIGNKNGTKIEDQTIYIGKENVTLSHLKIYGYANATSVVKVYANYSTVTDCEIAGGLNAHDVQQIGWSQKGKSGIGTGHKILRNKIYDLTHGIYINYPYESEIAYNEMYDFYLLWGYQDYGGYAIGGANKNPQDGYWDAQYTYHVHHNDIYNFEYVAISQAMSRAIYEYNEIHHNLDERIYRGGVKHGSIGKVYDFQSTTDIGSLGLIFRYNYVHDLIRRGEANYTYKKQTKELVKNKSFKVETTNNGIGQAVYLYSAREGGAYWPHFGDQIDVNGNPIGEGPDCVISGLGYANFFIHNNLFYNCSNSINNRQFSYINGTTTEKPYRKDLGSYFVNNTILKCGWLEYITNNTGGLFYSERKAQSPYTFVNNIIDYTLPNARWVGRWREDDIYIDHNIYTRQSGVKMTNWKNYPSPGDNVAHIFDGGNTVLNTGIHDQYLTNPNWRDTTATIFVSNLGDDGAYLPDVRITEGGSANNNGMDYDLIGDNYTDPNGFKHEFGKDPTGRSFAYDILGNYRITNDIGAVGIASTGTADNVITHLTPIITSQPLSQIIESGMSVTFSVSASCNDPIGYQWWKSPFVSETESKITDNSKYSGATTNQLTINNVQLSDGNINYMCKVYNTSDPSNLWINSDPVELTATSSNSFDSENFDGLKVFLEGAYREGEMKTTLSKSGLLPLNQPYNISPWNLQKDSKISSLDNSYVDWIIVELRDDFSSIKYRKSGILQKNGMIINSDGSDFSFSNIVSANYYIVIKHRNHLAIMSSQQIKINDGEKINYDFTISQDLVYGNNPLNSLGDGNLGMIAGDGDANNTINNLDFGIVANKIPYGGYAQGDLDLNGVVNVLDYEKINKNILKSSQVP